MPLPREPARGLCAVSKAKPGGAGPEQLVTARPARARCAGRLQIRPDGVFLCGREQGSRCGKLEKAHILEMTVRFLKEVPASPCPEASPGE